MRKLKPVTPGELLREEFLGPMGLSQYRLAKESEHRFIAIGTSAKSRALIVVYTERRGNARIISCRKATRRERRTYEEGNG